MHVHLQTLHTKATVCPLLLPSCCYLCYRAEASTADCSECHNNGMREELGCTCSTARAGRAPQQTVGSKSLREEMRRVEGDDILRRGQWRQMSHVVNVKRQKMIVVVKSGVADHDTSSHERCGGS